MDIAQLSASGEQEPTLPLTVADQVEAAELFNRCMRVVSLDQVWTARLETGEFDETDRDTLAEIGYRIASELEHIAKTFPSIREVLTEEEEHDEETAQALDRAMQILGQQTDAECSIIARKVDAVKGGRPVDGDIAGQLLGAVLIAAGFVVGSGGRWLHKRKVIKSDADTNNLAAALMAAGTTLVAAG